MSGTSEDENDRFVIFHKNQYSIAMWNHKTIDRINAIFLKIILNAEN